MYEPKAKCESENVKQQERLIPPWYVLPEHSASCIYFHLSGATGTTGEHLPWLASLSFPPTRKDTSTHVSLTSGRQRSDALSTELNKNSTLYRGW